MTRANGNKFKFADSRSKTSSWKAKIWTHRAFVRTRTAKQNPRCSKTKTGYYFMSNKLQETETGAVNWQREKNDIKTKKCVGLFS